MKSEMFYGWAGKIAEIDLSSGKARIEDIDHNIIKNYLGGRGLNIKILYDRLRPGTKAFDPDNIIVFSSGPLVRTGFPVANRCVVSTKSPLTYYAMCLAGGYFSAELKSAGLDAIIITGSSPKPVQILIEDGQIKIEDASDLWGLGTYETQIKIQNQWGKKYRVACIGPAGEKLSRMASVMFDQRTAGRGGIGAVMGSKKLKAISVKGSGRISIYNEDRMKSLIKDLFNEVKKKPGPRLSFPKEGTLGAVENLYKHGLMPSKNFQQGVIEHIEAIGLKGLLPFAEKHSITCFNCPVKCTNAFKISANQMIVHGPEYESFACFGGMCAISDPQTIIQANHLCNDLGLDTISTGVTLSFAMECIEKGLISKLDNDSKHLNFGKADTFLKAIVKTGLRQGDFPFMIGEGTKILSEFIGNESSKFAPQVKGQEIAMYEPRASMGMALVFAIANRGACHHSQGHPVKEEIVNGSLYDPKGKGKLIKELAQSRILIDSVSYCSFLTGALHWSLPEALSAATGIDYSWKMLEDISDRISTLERLFILREGCTSKEDTLPSRFIEEPLPNGPASGHKVDRQLLNQMIIEYYNACNWGVDGVPGENAIK